MRFIKNIIVDKIVESAINAGHKPAELPPNENERLEDLERLKLIEKNIYL